MCACYAYLVKFLVMTLGGSFYFKSAAIISQRLEVLLKEM
jgi:hypothetical protein